MSHRYTVIEVYGHKETLQQGLDRVPDNARVLQILEMLYHGGSNGLQRQGWFIVTAPLEGFA